MNRWLLNIISSYARFVVSIGAVVYVTPLIIERVGLENYGIWAIVLATIGLLGLMDFGLATSAVKLIAERTGQSDFAGRNRVLSVLLTLYSAIAAVLLIASGIIFFTVESPWIYESSDQGALLAIATTGCVAASLFLSLFRATLAGAGLMYLANAAEISTTIVYLVLTLALVGHGIPGLCAALFASTVFAVVITALLACRKVSGLKLRLTLCKWAELKGLLSFSAWAFLANAAVLAILRMDPIIIERFMPLTAVAIYAVAARIAEYALLINKQFSNALMPLISQSHSRGDHDSVAWVLKDGSRYLLIIALPMLSLIAFHADTLLVLWLGEELVTAALPMRILLAAVALSVLHLNAANVLGMTGHHRFVGTAMLVAAGLNLLLTVILIPNFGLAGVALATLTATALIEVGLIIPTACRLSGVSIAHLFRHALTPATTFAIPVVAIAAAHASAYPPSSLLGLVVNGIVSIAMALPILILAGLSPNERGRIADVVSRFGNRVPALSRGA